MRAFKGLRAILLPDGGVWKGKRCETLCGQPLLSAIGSESSESSVHYKNDGLPGRNVAPSPVHRLPGHRLLASASLMSL